MAVENDMHKTTHASLHNWMANSISIAVSSAEYDLDGGLGYNEIRKILVQHGTIDDDIIEQVLVLDNVSSSGFHTSMYGVDIGFSYYCKLAFYLFGYSVASLLYLYFVFLVLSIVLFLIAFRNNDAALVFLVVFLLAYYSITSSIPDLGSNGGVIYTYRFMSILALLPIAHIGLISLVDYEERKHRLRYFGYVTVVLQSVIIVSMYYVRSSVGWMFIFAFIILFLNLYSSIKRRNSPHGFVGILKTRLIFHSLPKFVNKSTPVLILFGVLLVMNFMLQNNLSTEYADQRGGRHVFWHSVFLGQAIQPEIRAHYTNSSESHLDKYFLDGFCAERKLLERKIYKGFSDVLGLRKQLCSRPEFLSLLLEIRNKTSYYFSNTTTDQDAYSATNKWLYEHNEDEHKLFNFDRDQLVAYKDLFDRFRRNEKLKVQDSILNSALVESDVVTNPKFDFTTDFNWSENDRILGHIVKDVIKSHPLEVIEVVFITKPVRFLSFYLNNYFIVNGIFHMIVIFVIFFLLTSIKKDMGTDDVKKLVRFLFVMFICSMTIPIVIYPAPHLISDQAIIVTTLIYLSIIITVCRRVWGVSRFLK
jgi:hypothetical protein